MGLHKIPFRNQLDVQLTCKGKISKSISYLCQSVLSLFFSLYTLLNYGIFQIFLLLFVHHFKIVLIIFFIDCIFTILLPF